MHSLLDPTKGDVVIDYRAGPDAVRAAIADAAAKAHEKDGPVRVAFDAISEHGSIANIAPALTPPAAVTVVLGVDTAPLPAGVAVERTMVGSVHSPPSPALLSGSGSGSGSETLGLVRDAEFGAALVGLFGRGLAGGWFSGHPYEVRPGGLAGLEGALRDLREGKASGVKYVVRIGETEGVRR